MNKLNLDTLSEDELRVLNQEIVRRLQLMSFVRNKSKLMAFRLGDRVAFETDRGTKEGTVVRVNQKTVSIETVEGNWWRVSPSYLTKVATEADGIERQPSLFSIADGKKVNRP